MVQPLADATAVEVAPTEAPELPDALNENPLIQAVTAGAPPAVSGSIEEFSKRPETKLLTEHRDTLFEAGFGLYRSLDGGTGVLFNQRFINGEALKQADQAGQLQQVAPPFDTVEGEISKSGLKHPSLKPPSGQAMAQPPPPAVASATSAPAPLPASAQRKGLTAKISNVQPGSPTSGPVPGAGRLLNNILKPVL